MYVVQGQGSATSCATRAYIGFPFACSPDPNAGTRTNRSDRDRPGPCTSNRSKLLCRGISVDRNMSSHFVLVLGALLLITDCASAQAQAPTDNELYAAYCGGVMRELDQGNAVVQQASRRFSAYLMATGVLTDPQRSSANIGAAMAIARGRTEARQCSAAIVACSDKVLGKEGTPPPRDNKSSQLLACMEATPCARTTRCLQPDNLPF